MVYYKCNAYRIFNERVLLKMAQNQKQPILQRWYQNKVQNRLLIKNKTANADKIIISITHRFLQQNQQKRMGQQTSTSTFQQKNWQTISSTGGKKILFNTQNNRSVQKHESMIDSDEKQIIEVCKWRQQLKQEDYVVQMYQYGVKKPGLCNGLPQVYVITERLALFQDIGGFSLGEGMLLLREVVMGFKVLFGRFGYFNPFSTIIGINSQGKAKVWSNENFALYEPLRSPSSIQTPSSQLTITNRLVSLLQSKTLPTSKYPYPVSYPKNLDIESLLSYLNNLLSTLPMQYQIDKIYLDRAQFQKKYMEIQEKAKQDELSKTKGVDVERRLREVGQLEAGIRQQQMQLEQKQLYIRMIERQRQEEAIRLQAEMLRIQQQQNRKQQELMMLHHLEMQRQHQFQLQQQQHQLSRQKLIQLQRQQQMQYQRQQQLQLIKQQQSEAQRQQFKKKQHNQVPYYAHPTDIQMMNHQPQIQYQQLHPQYQLQQPSVANPSQAKTMKGTTSTVQSQNKPTRIQYPAKQPPMPPTTHQRTPSAIIHQALQQMPIQQKISRKNSYESYRTYNSNGSKIKKEIEMVDSMILMQDDEMSDQQNKRYIESRIIQYPVHPA